ncbi:MAG: hypothetical protein LBK58_04970 [Prevotellaceae bacterium]|jgi:hypothetical protein|nr:hypothetical protein [Prevotellaceae bacterium]
METLKVIRQFERMYKYYPFDPTPIDLQNLTLIGYLVEDEDTKTLKFERVKENSNKFSNRAGKKRRKNNDSNKRHIIQ